MKRLTLLSVSIVLITNLIYSQSIEVKDGSANTLIQINDEGTTGSITLPSGSAPGTPTSKLYNEGGTLKWSGSVLGTGGSSLWLVNGSNIYRNTGNVGIGIDNPLSRLSVGTSGRSDALIFSGAVNGTAIWGENIATTGTGIYGGALHISGANYGVYGETFSKNGWAGYFIGRGYFSGNVGIGISSPDEKLHIAGNLRLNGSFEDKDGQAGTSGQILSSTVSGTNWIAVPSGADNLGNHTATENINLAGNWISGDGSSEGVFINTAGSVGIGTSEPNEEFVLYDTDGSASISVQHSTTGTSNTDGLELEMTSSNVFFRNHESGDLSIGTNSSTDIFIEDGGQIGIQTTSPEASLDVSGDVILGVNGTRFLEVREITGTTGASGHSTTISDALPPGWTGDNTRILSLEVYNSDGIWTTNGFSVPPEWGIWADLDADSRTMIINYPNLVKYQNQPFRAMILGMP